MSAAKKLTFGGLPEAEAYHWTPEKYQEFGRIVFLICSAKAEDRRRGRNEFYEFKRHFMVYEFDEILDDLNDFRSRKGFKTIDALLQEIGDQLVEKEVLPAQESHVDISDYVEVMERRPKFCDEKEKAFFNQDVEQLSLFA